jgi:hypothetical protein
MVLYRTAYTLGIEPSFFSHSSDKTHLKLMPWWPSILSSSDLYFIVCNRFLPIFKLLMIRDSSYWEAMKVVPLIILANFFLGIYTNLSVWYKLMTRYI